MQPAWAVSTITSRPSPPVSAPPRVKAVIEAANKIRTKPYIWGGGHARCVVLIEASEESGSVDLPAYVEKYAARSRTLGEAGLYSTADEGRNWRRAAAARCARS